MRNRRLHVSLTVLVVFFSFLALPTDAAAVVQSLNGQTGQNQTFQDDSNVVVSSSNNIHSILWSGLLPISRGGTGASSFANGSIPFIWNGIFSEDNSSFYWDNTNKRLGIGTTSPSSALEVSGNVKVISLTSANDSTVNSITIGKGGGSVSSNTAVGMNALTNNTTGVYNTAVGNDALSSNATAFANTAVGNGALSSSLSNANTAVGSDALHNAYGELNTAVGASALGDTTTGSRNVAFGYAALRFNTSGVDNTAAGVFSMVNNTTGINNASLGGNSLGANTTGSGNTAIGQTAFLNNITGGGNTVLGYEAARWQAGGSNLTTANNNVYIGALVRGYDNNDFNSIVLGHNAIGAGTNKAVIGNSSMTDVYLGSSDANANVHAKKMYLGSLSVPGCIVMGDTAGGVGYITLDNGVLTVSATPPAACQ